ncbi:tRNA (guanine(37)-N1)-methyltransferase 1-like, partial [Macadamia integrifolia]|uniref:tRNA (guanine(37)-N1)-methyltransferase 1-like n=1 Tax=Macadamia integrifolia TaxID=60698 RepID=UPI001C4FB881
MKTVLRCNSLPFGIICARRLPQTPLPLPLHSRTSILPLFCTNSSTIAVTLDRDLAYGPSLRKGKRPYLEEQGQQQHQLPHFPVRIPNEEGKEEEEEGSLIDKESFSRVFDVAAIRVPSEDCFALENRLRGHLLNWPRVRNIARVPGDEMDDEFRKILGEQCCNGDGDDEEVRLVDLDRRIYGKADGDGESLSPILYRDMLAKTFNSRGFVKFRNLAKISRPKRKNRRKEGEGIQGKKRIGKNDFVVVEVVEDNDEEDDMSGLLGDDFKRGRWRGSTRLLLLDEQYANKGVEDLPEAVK